MIPKIIHYCWFGGKEKPQEVLDYMETWRQWLPGYELKEWNESNFDHRAWRFTREAYALHKYAFVSDVARLVALYKYGGLYFDTDIEVVGSFEPLMHHRSFVGYEVNDLIGTGVIGAERGVEWISVMLDTYRDRDFILPNGELDEPNTVHLTKLMPTLAEAMRPTVLPIETLCAMSWETHEVIRNANTISIHHYKASWKTIDRFKLDRIDRIERKLCRMLHRPCPHLYVRLLKLWLTTMAWIHQ